MQISRFAVARPVTTLMAFCAIVVLGAVSYLQIPVQLFPDLTIPTIGVFMRAPDASPADSVEKLTKPVEGILAELPKIRRTRSWTGAWGTWIQADFDHGADIRFITVDLQERLNSFQQGLEDRRTEINVTPFSTDEFNNFLMELAVEGPEDEEFLQDIIRDKIEPRLESVSGVARVTVGGLRANAADVEIVPDLLAGFGLEFGSVFQRIQSAAVQDTFLGSIDVPGARHYVRLDAPVRNVAELARAPVEPNGVVRVGDIANVTTGAAVEGEIYRANGNYAIGVNVEREQTENLIAVATKVRAEIERINEGLPEGVRIAIRTDIAEIVQEIIDQVRDLALLGGLLALAVPLIFFRSLRVSSIIFLSVPICIIAVFNLFYAFGVSLNVLSIIGLALGVGMLVDNSIVVVENCFRLHFTKRLGAIEAARQGGDEVGRALFASTLTSVVPFIGFFFIDGEFKLFVKEPTMALVFPLLASLAVALTLSAMLSSRVLLTMATAKPGTRRAKRLRGGLDPAGRRQPEGYRLLLKASIRHRARDVLVIAALLAVVWLEACDQVREANTSRERTEDVFRFYMTMAPGSKLADANAAVVTVEQRLKEHEDIDQFSVWFDSAEGRVDVTLKKRDERPSGRSLAEIRASILEFVGSAQGAELSLTPPSQPISANSPLATERGSIALKGLDLPVIEAHALRVIDAISAHPSIATVEVDRDREQPEYHAVLDREKTRLFGTTANSVSQLVGVTRASGTISSLRLKDGEKQTDVTISVLSTGADQDLASVADVPIYTELGTVAPLGELASFEASQTPARIVRADRQGSVDLVYTWLPGTDQGELTGDLRRILAAVPNPGGVVAEFEGPARQFEERQQQFLFVLGIGVMLIYVVMAAVFESFWAPFVILASNPLMLIGIVIALAITDLPFDELAAFGVILLNGLAVNNGIVLMDTALRYRNEQGYRRVRAVFQAADQRLRPILMTFLTTMLGLLPLAVTGDETSQWRPVAVTVLGGLTSATFLTLIVLPCFYLIGDDIVAVGKRFLVGFGRLFLWIDAANGSVVRGSRLGWPVRWIWRWEEPSQRFLRGLLLAPVHVLGLLLRGLWRQARLGFPLPRAIARAVIGDLAVLLRDLLGGPSLALAAGHDDLPSESAPAEPLVELRNVHVVFPPAGFGRVLAQRPRRGIPLGHNPAQGVAALAGVTLTARRGLLGLLGPNGAGKSTRASRPSSATCPSPTAWTRR